MATINILACSGNQSSRALSSTLSYCMREAKTELDGEKLVTGINCVAENAYTEMMCTKNRFEKTDGRMYYHLDQSFHPDEKITPQLAHKIACEFAENQFKGYEVVVATHIDADHIHSHFVVNSVSFEDGKKYHSDRNNIQKLRDASDEICRKYGLSVIENRKNRETEDIGTREYRSALKGESWKITLAVNVTDCMTKAKTKDEFKELMKRKGYQVAWENNRKYITYTTPDGKKCRDNKLHDMKFRKEVMECEFNIRAEIQRSYADEPEYAGAGFKANQMCGDNGDELEWNYKGGKFSDGSNKNTSGYASGYSESGGNGEVHQSDAGNDKGKSEWNEDGINTELFRTGWETERGLCFSAGGDSSAVSGTNEEMDAVFDGSGSADIDIGSDILGLIASLGGTTSDEDEKDKMHKQYVSERKDKEKESQGFKISY